METKSAGTLESRQGQDVKSLKGNLCSGTSSRWLVDCTRPIALVISAIVTKGPGCRQFGHGTIIRCSLSMMNDIQVRVSSAIAEVMDDAVCVCVCV